MSKILKSWREFIKEIHAEINFFDYLENYYKKINTITKNSWKTTDNIIITSSHPPLETININIKDQL